MKRIKNTFFACLLMVCVLFTAGSSAKSLVEQEANRRYSFYQRALYEACEEMAQMQIVLKKLTVTQSKAMETEYLSKVSLYANSVQNSLSTLPIGVHEVSDTMKFVNQTGDFALSALKKISKGGMLTEDDRKILISLTETSTQMCVALGELTENFTEGRYAFDEDEKTSEGGFQNLVHPKDEYPTLLYDGPFSDSLLDKRMKGLGENMVTKEDAQRAVADFLEIDVSGIRFTQETRGNEKTYVFEIPDRNQEAAVTQRGGKVLYILSEKTGGEERIPEEKCAQIAREFLLKKGFGEAEISYFRKYDGVITINLAPVEKGIVLYSDLIKVEVDMETGEIAGFEATNYYMNHVKRNFPENLTMNTPETELENMTVVSVRPALIPLATNEKLTYEIHVKDEKNEYLIYRDAETNDEIMLYEVVHTPDGTIVQ